jgi:hypothetical protein
MSDLFFITLNLELSFNRRGQGWYNIHHSEAPNLQAVTNHIGRSHPIGEATDGKIWIFYHLLPLLLDVIYLYDWSLSVS